MGSYKKLFVDFLNKRNYPLIKIYSFYRKDIWGFLKMRRLYKYKRAIYNILRKKRKFYYRILNIVYRGIFFIIKRYNYRANLFFIKKRLKLFYGTLKLVYIGKLGLSIKRKKGFFLYNFFSFLERRIDVILYRSFYTITIRMGRRLVCLKYIIKNNILLNNPNLILLLGDIIHINHYPFGYLFLYLVKGKIINNYYKRIFYLVLFKNFFMKTLYTNNNNNKNFKRFFFFKSFKKILKEQYISFLFIKPRKRKLKRRFQRFIDLFFYLRFMFYKIFKRIFYKLKKRFKNKNSFIFFKLKFLKKKKHKIIYLLYKNLKISKFKKLLLFNKLFKMLKKKTNKYNFKKINKKKYFFFFFKFLLLNIYRYFKYLKYIKYQFFFIRKKKKYLKYLLYFNNLNIYRLRFRKFLYLLFPKKRKRLKNFPLMRRAKFLNLNKVKFRKWKFSIFVFRYFLKFSKFDLFFFGSPSFLLIDYITHSICVVKSPSFLSIKYPFGIRINFFFSYFKQKAYF